MLVPSYFFGPVWYYAFLFSEPAVTFEGKEHFTKQTYRNRCFIDAPNDVLPLIVPVLKKSPKMRMEDVCIDYGTPWVEKHKRARVTGYSGTPYFEYYDYLFDEVLRQGIDSLMELNVSIHKLIMKCLDDEQEVEWSEDFLPIRGKSDSRVFFDVKPHRFAFSMSEYRQAFGYKFGFRKHLSILDLLYNLGPESRMFLSKEKERVVLAMENV